MPIYEYRCSHCQHELEAIQKMSDAALRHCDACGQDTLQRLISRSSFQLKGDGWYATDYKDNKSKTTVTDNGGAVSETKDDSATTTASTPAKTGDTTSAAPATSPITEKS